MRYNKLNFLVAAALFVLPLSFAKSIAASAASPPNAQGFNILLSDGTLLRGAVSFTMNIDTQYGRLSVPSTNFVSARFSSPDGWADIRTQSTRLLIQYKPGTSSLSATTDLGPLNVDLTKVVSVEPANAQVLDAAQPEAVNPNDQGNQVPAAPPDIYSQPATAIDVSPYEYGAAAPYYWPPYYAVETSCYPAAYSYGYPFGCGYGCGFGAPFCWWPFCGFGNGFVFAGNFGRDHFGHFGDRFGDRFGHDFGVGRNGIGAAQSVRPFGGAAGLNRGAFGSAFGSASFRSAAAPAFRSAAAPAFRSAAAPAFRSAASSTFRSGTSFSRGGFSRAGNFSSRSSGARFSGGGFSHGGGFGGGGGFGHGGGGHGR